MNNKKYVLWAAVILFGGWISYGAISTYVESTEAERQFNEENSGLREELKAATSELSAAIGRLGYVPPRMYADTDGISKRLETSKGIVGFD